MKPQTEFPIEQVPASGVATAGRQLPPPPAKGEAGRGLVPAT